MAEPSNIACDAGERRVNDECIPCESGTYNHGNAHHEKEDCYIVKDREIVYKDRFSVKCAPGWVGIPFYEDGEYEGGCYDADNEIYDYLPYICKNLLNMTPRLLGKSPTQYPTKYPSRDPSPFPSKKPSPYPTRFPTRTPSNYPTANPVTRFPTNIPSQLPTLPPKKIFCDAGKHYNMKTKKCVPCENGRYNHGGMHFREECYQIPQNAIFSYLNTTDIQCDFGGIPVYHNGEYEYGCFVTPPISVPTNFPSARLTQFPTIIPSARITQFPTIIPSARITQIPSVDTTQFPSCVSYKPCQPCPSCTPAAACPPCTPAAACPNIALLATIILASVMGIYGICCIIKKPIRKFLRRRRRIENQPVIELTETQTAHLPSADSMRVIIPNSPHVRITRQTSASI